LINARTYSRNEICQKSLRKRWQINPQYRVTRSECRRFNNLSYNIHLR